MSAPVCPSPCRKISAAMWSTYIGEAIQSGNHKKYCIEHNLSYRTFNDYYKLYKQSIDKENWSPRSKRRLSHRVFTDSTEKEAVEQFEQKFDETCKPRDGNDLAMLLLMIHNKKYPNCQLIKVSHSTLTRIKQQFNMSTKRTTKRKSSTTINLTS